jgi:ABC-type Fe3+/spermidine/putrescine transport system ATPase subunit
MAAPRATDPFVVADSLTLRYPGAAGAAVDGVGFVANQGEVVTLLGPSGCGKTSALRLLAGLETPDSGTVTVGGEDITRWSPERRRMGFVFQNYALFPHLSVAENVAFGLRVRGASDSERRDAVQAALDLVDLASFDDRRIDQLSGGQQQRVALARALAIRPAVLLMDEPLSNLDTALREQTREALRDLLGKLEITTFFVTHDQAEAFAFSDRIVLMRAGRVVETGTPERLYRDPETAFAAEFLGAANVLPARVVEPGRSVRVGDGPEQLDVAAWSADVAAAAPGDPVSLVARPEALALATGPEADTLSGRIVDSVFTGAAYRVAVVLDGSGLAVRTLTRERVANEPVHVRLPAESLRAIRHDG